MNLIDQIFYTSQYKTEAERYQARVIYFVTVLIGLFYALYAVITPEWLIEGESRLVTLLELSLLSPDRPESLAFYSIYLLSGLALIATRAGFLRVASWIPFVTWYISGVLLLSFYSAAPGWVSGAIILLLILGGLLNGQIGIILGWGISLVTLGMWAVANPQNVTLDLSSVIIQFSGGAILIYLFLRYARFTRYEGAAEAVESRLVASEVVTSIANRVSQRDSLDVLLAEIVNQINGRYDFIYHVQVFLIDENRVAARLVASTGEVGQKLLELHHSLNVGSRSVIGEVTSEGHYIIARANSDESVHRPNDLLPQTAVEAAFPLRIGEHIIGALDVQSKQVNAFARNNIVMAFQSLADGIALVIDNVQQYEQAQTQLAENNRLIKEARDALAENKRLNERLIRQAWSDYLKGTGDRFSLDIDLETGEEHALPGWTPTLQEAMQINHIVQKEQAGRQVVAVPLLVRGQIIGAMEFELDEDHTFTAEEFDLMREVSERFGLAVENVRLLDESQRTAEREALVNQISSQIQSANNVEAMLTETAKSLRTVLKAERIAIRLGAPKAEETS